MKKSGKLFFVLFLGFSFSLAARMEEIFPVAIHGYISQGFMYSNHNNYLADTKNGTFQFNEMGINFSTQVIDKLRIGMQLAALDLGDLGNDKITLDWAYADYRWRDWFGIRLGKIKIPMGFYNKTRDIDMLRTFILHPQSIYSETYRDTLIAMKGISGYGEIPLHALGNISYEAIYGTMNIDRESSTTKGIEGAGFFKVEKYDVKRTSCWAITWETPLQGLRLGATRINADFNLTAILTKDLTASIPNPPYQIIVARAGTSFIGDSPDFSKTVYALEYTWKDFVLAVEYSRQDFTQTSRVKGQTVLKRTLKYEGFYLSATYRFSDRFETGAYYGVFYKDRNDRDGTRTPYNPPFSAYQKDGCLSFRFDPNDHWTFKLEGHLLDGTGLCYIQDNQDDNGQPQYTRKWYLLAAKMTFSF
ncbi:MAG TPA: hypothetical protein VK186_23840 [Candidatus Deferrimicrobium sp.]|nr:hypothetical protein [Candidatus Deferrimicrobium sp.]